MVHFYRAVVGHMDVWRQRMDATTNWAAATTAVMVTFTFGAVDSPHFVMLLALGFNGVFLLMESRRYQIFDLWRRRFRLLNRYLIAPVISGSDVPDAAARQEAMSRVAEDLGRMVPHLPLHQAVGYRVRRNYIHLIGVGTVAWVLKLEVHPSPTTSVVELVDRAAVGVIPGSLVVSTLFAFLLLMLVLAVRAPSEQMMGWTDIPSPFQRWMTRTRAWRPNRSESQHPE
jgi:uncharacterized membrane protein